MPSSPRRPACPTRPTRSTPPTCPTPSWLAAVESFEDRFLDRELSWLRFNQRVLELAEDPTLPLLERARFLAIFTSNLDEFFMVRVAGLKRRIAAGLAVRGRLRADAARGARADLDDQPASSAERQAELFRDEIVPALRRARHRAGALGRPRPRRAEGLQAALQGPHLPGAHAAGRRPGAPVPLHLRALAQPRRRRSTTRRPTRSTSPGSRCRRPSTASCRWAHARRRFVPLEDVIGAHLKRLFPGMEVLEAHTFRVTRNEDLEVEEDDAENLLAALEKELLRRRFGPPVRLEVEESISEQRARPARLRARRHRRGGLPAARPARPARAARHRRPRRARS